jgi:hypothetical protein
MQSCLQRQRGMSGTPQKEKMEIHAARTLSRMISNKLKISHEESPTLECFYSHRHIVHLYPLQGLVGILLRGAQAVSDLIFTADSQVEGDVGGAGPCSHPGLCGIHRQEGPFPFPLLLPLLPEIHEL